MDYESIKEELNKIQMLEENGVITPSMKEEMLEKLREKLGLVRNKKD